MLLPAILMKTFMMNNIFPQLKISLFMVSVPLLLLSCNNEGGNKEMQKANSKIDSLSTELKQMNFKLDSLQDLWNEKEMFLKSDTVYFGKEYSKIENPQEFIKNALKENPEIIPLEPVLGGTMQFRKIDILSNIWLFAMYDDGHIQGESIFEYQLQPDGNIEFSVLISKSN